MISRRHGFMSCHWTTMQDSLVRTVGAPSVVRPEDISRLSFPGCQSSSSSAGNLVAQVGHVLARQTNQQKCYQQPYVEGLAGPPRNGVGRKFSPVPLQHPLDRCQRLRVEAQQVGKRVGAFLSVLGQISIHQKHQHLHQDRTLVALQPDAFLFQTAYVATEQVLLVQALLVLHKLRQPQFNFFCHLVLAGQRPLHARRCLLKIILAQLPVLQLPEHQFAEQAYFFVFEQVFQQRAGRQVGDVAGNRIILGTRRGPGRPC